MKMLTLNFIMKVLKIGQTVMALRKKIGVQRLEILC